MGRAIGLNSPSRRAQMLAGACAAVMLAGAGPAFADRGIPLLVTYGKDQKAEEGDHNFRQSIYFAVPASHQGRLHVHIFDPDTNHTHDTPYNTWGDTRTRFSVFGGAGTYRVPASRDDAETGGERLAARVFGSSRRRDNRWLTIARVKPSDGELIGEERIFRVDVEGLNGDDGNVFDVAISTGGRDNAAPDGLRLFSFLPTFRVPAEDVLSELRFAVPRQATSIKAHNFDAVGAGVAFTGRLRSVPLMASGQGAWLVSDITPDQDERGALAAITVEGGDEIPNDVSIFVTDQAGTPLPVTVPILAHDPNRRPWARAEITPTGCGNMRFDASPTIDDTVGPVGMRWRFDDGSEKSGAVATKRYSSPGRYRARLEATDASGLVGATTVRDFDFAVLARPRARIEAAQVVAPGVPVRFDGGGSLMPGGDPAIADATGKIADYRWQFSDDVELAGESIERSFDRPGNYNVRLLVTGDTDHPCNRASTRHRFRVNAAPVANAGDNVHVATGESVNVDAGASRDSDGEIARYRWDFGDGTAAVETARATHAYARPGTYRIALTVDDGAGVANSTASDSLSVRVNAPPEPDAGGDRNAVAGQPVMFDASNSRDRDGNIIAYRWAFGDGATATGAKRLHTFWEAGTYTVELTAIDDSGRGNDQSTDIVTVSVAEPDNTAPRADAGGDITAKAGEIITFDASASSDADGNVVDYQWAFGEDARGQGISPTYTFHEPGRYQVRLMVRDERGGSARTAISVNVTARDNTGGTSQ